MTYKTFLIKKKKTFSSTCNSYVYVYVCRKKYHKSRQVFNHHSHFLKIGLNSAQQKQTDSGQTQRSTMTLFTIVVFYHYFYSQLPPL